MKPELTVPGTNLLTLNYDEPLSTFAFKFNLRRYKSMSNKPGTGGSGSSNGGGGGGSSGK